MSVDSRTTTGAAAAMAAATSGEGKRRPTGRGIARTG
jgi:hypothetical protein